MDDTPSKRTQIQTLQILAIDNNVNLRKAAKLAGVSSGTLSRWIHGKQEPMAFRVALIERAIRDIVNGENGGVL